MSEAVAEYLTRCACGRETKVEVPLDGLLKWKRGALIQDALPDLSDDEREALLTGTCPACWDEMYGDEDGDDAAPARGDWL